MSFHNTRHVNQTRRARRCDWCHEIIIKGDPSVATSGSDGSDFYTGRYHPECCHAIGRWQDRYLCWGEELPSEPMNRGGIMPKGEPEEEKP